MAIQRQNIKKHIENQPKPKIYLANGKQPAQPKSIIEAMLPAAQKFVENMEPKYKLAIAGVVYLILAGVVGTVIGIVKLINLI